VTKCGIRLVGHERGAVHIKHYDSSPGHIVASVERSLAALGTDRVDLLLIHRPDPLMQPETVAEAVARLRRDGKVLAFGVSNFTPSQFALLDAATPLATNQIEFHPLHSAPLFDGTLDQALQLRRRPMVWSPLAGGRLVGGDESPAAQRVRWVLGTIAGRLGTSPAMLAYAWLLRHPSQPRPIVGSRRIEGLRDALDAQALALDAESWFEILQAGRGFEVA
jgi:predicted oxidoreductase